MIGPYRIDMSQYLSAENLTVLAEQVLSAVQPLLGQAGGLLATVASGTASTVGWGLFRDIGIVFPTRRYGPDAEPVDFH